MLNILKGFIIGIAVSIPVGPIAIMVIQKSLNYGRRAGLMAGLGATLVDTVFAVIAIYALAGAQKFIGNNDIAIMIIGGLIVLVLGCVMALNDPFRRVPSEKQHSSFSTKDFLQSVALGISNPGAILPIFALFAFFFRDEDIVQNYNDISIAAIIFAVSLGSVFYWFIFSWLFSIWKDKFKLRELKWLNKITGIIVMLIGIALCGDGLFKLIFR